MFSFFVRPKKSSKKTSLVRGSKSDLYKSNRDRNNGDKRSYKFVQKLGLILGPLLFVLILLIFTTEGLNPEARVVLSSTSWIEGWWMCEAVTIRANSLLLIVVVAFMKCLQLDLSISA